MRYHRPIAYATPRFRAWTEGWDLGALLTFKWVLSFAYMAAMLALAILLMRLLQGISGGAPPGARLRRPGPARVGLPRPLGSVLPWRRSG